jgi:hypothetical protein
MSQIFSTFNFGLHDDTLTPAEAEADFGSRWIPSNIEYRTGMNWGYTIIISA